MNKTNEMIKFYKTVAISILLIVICNIVFKNNYVLVITSILSVPFILKNFVYYVMEIDFYKFLTA